MSVDWQSVINTAIVGVGGTVAISAAAVWLIRTSLTEWLARETEVFKTRLKTDADMEIEKLKSSLQITATEHQVMFSRMHEKRATVIEEVYKKLTELHSSAAVFVLTSENSPNPQHKEESDRIRTRLIEYSSFMEQHKIFLPTGVCNLLNDHLRRVREAVHIAGSWGGSKVIITPELAQKSYDAFMSAYKAFNVDIPAAQTLLETEFRKMLGVE